MEYADFPIEFKTGKFDKIQKRTVRIIHRNQHKDMKYDDLLKLYGIDDLALRRGTHHLSVIYRNTRNVNNLEIGRPDISLRSNSKIKFKISTTKLTKVQMRPFVRGVLIWDHLPEAVQRATTMVKFKQDIDRLLKLTRC